MTTPKPLLCACALLAVLSESFPRARAECRCDITLEIREMRRELYFKAATAGG